MAVSAHLQELENKHANLDTVIMNELKSPAPDTIRLSELKKQKLYLKDQLSHFRSG